MNKTIFPIVTNMGKFDCEDIHENELTYQHKYKASEDEGQIRNLSLDAVKTEPEDADNRLLASSNIVSTDVSVCRSSSGSPF